jgi:hypothetical protein
VEIEMEQHLRYSIHQPGQILGFIGGIIARAGGQNAAARHLQMEPGHFSRLRQKLQKRERELATGSKPRERRRRGAGKEVFITQRTLDRLLNAVPAGDQETLLEATVPQRALKEYERWLQKMLAEYDPGAESGTAWATRTAGALVRALKATHHGKHFEKFEDQIRKRWGALTPGSEREQRVFIAECLAVAPLLAIWQTGGIERGAGELEDMQELSAYLKDSLKAQEHLLRRKYATNRLQPVRSAPSTVSWESGQTHPNGRRTFKVKKWRAEQRRSH